MIIKKKKCIFVCIIGAYERCGEIMGGGKRIMSENEVCETLLKDLAVVN